MIHHTIYIPGLGDKRSYGQPTLLKLWRLFGVKIHYFPLGWLNDEGFDKKLGRLLSKIDELQKVGHRVSLVGVSAGASAVLNAYAQRPSVANVVCVCGKINNPQTVGERVYKENPDFRESVFALQKNLKKISKPERQRIMSIHPLEDKTVPPADTLIKDSLEKVVPAKGHIPGIYFSLVFASRSICQFIKTV